VPRSPASKRPDRCQTVTRRNRTAGTDRARPETIEEAARARSITNRVRATVRRTVVAIGSSQETMEVHRHDMEGAPTAACDRDGPHRAGTRARMAVDGASETIRACREGKPATARRQRGQQLRQDAARRRTPVVGMAVPGRKCADRQVRREEFQRAGSAARARAVEADHGQGTAPASSGAAATGRPPDQRPQDFPPSATWQTSSDSRRRPQTKPSEGDQALAASCRRDPTARTT